MKGFRENAWLLFCAFGLMAFVMMSSQPAMGQGESAAQGGYAHGQGTGNARQDLEKVMQDPLFSRWKIRQERTSHLRVKDMGYGQIILDQLSAVRDGARRLFDWLFKNRSRAGSPASSSTPSPSFDVVMALKILGWVVVGMTILLLAWLFWARWRQHRHAGVTQPLTRQSLAAAMTRGDALIADSEDWVAHAVELIQEKDMRLAFRAMYLALLSGLHAGGQIRYRAEQTNWTYVMGFKGEELDRERFARITSQFDDIWYGLREPDRDLFDRIRGQVDQLLRRPAP